MAEREQLLEAIAHAEDVAQREGCTSSCGEEHAQLARWLKRLLELDFPPEPVPVHRLEMDSNVVSLDEHRIRVEREFEDESVAYLEALWGKTTVAFNVAIRDLEAMRRGRDHDKALRPPETDYEARLMVQHCRALANDIARFFGQDDLVRLDDDLREVPHDPERVG